MSLPLLVIGLTSIKFIPKTNQVNIFFKKLIGFILLGSAIYVAKPLLNIFVIELLFIILGLIVFIYALIALKLKKFIQIILLMLAVIASIFLSINSFKEYQLEYGASTSQMSAGAAWTVQRLPPVKDTVQVLQHKRGQQ